MVTTLLLNAAGNVTDTSRLLSMAQSEKRTDEQMENEAWQQVRSRSKLCLIYMPSGGRKFKKNGDVRTFAKD